MSAAGGPRMCVVGAGIAGLAAAWEIHRSAPEADLIVLEADSRPGGAIRTSRFAGRAVDEGADAFLARVDDGTRLCAESGLAADLVAPASGRAFVHLDGELVPLPDAHFLGVPLDPDNVGGALLSAAGLAALRADLAHDSAAAGLPASGNLANPAAPADPAKQPDGGGADEPASDGQAVHREPDQSIGALVRQRLGDEVLERLVGPLVGSINAGDCDRLSLHAAAPALAEGARSHPSLIRALRQQSEVRSGDGTAGPVFWGLRGGMERLTAALAEPLGPALALSEPARACLVRTDDRGGRPAIRGVETPARLVPCDAVVLAVGAAPTARLVEPWAPEVAALLARTQTASVAIVTLAYEAAAVPGAGAGSGFLVPPAAGLPITACSWASTKWAHLGAPDIDRDGDSAGAPRHASSGGHGDDEALGHRGRDVAILRVSLGRHGDDGIVGRPETELIEAARTGLATTMGLTATPLEVRVSRWPGAFPQYAVGHLDRTAAVEETLGAAGVFCAGAAYHGIGIPACIASGRRAAGAALAWAQNRRRP